MKRKWLPMLSILTMAGTASATVAEDQAKRASQTTFDQAVASTKAACGNATLTGSIDWAAYDTLPYTPSSTKEQALRSAGSYGTMAADAMKYVCGDPDYKKELAKITKVVGHPGTSGSFLTYSKTGTTIDVVFNGGNDADSRDRVKKLF